jgi:hypothetical protein
VTRAPTNATVAGRAYLAIQKKARAEGRATDELLQLFALEAFLDRLSTSPAAEDLVLKGGVLLAAYDMRRPTRDVDLSARNMSNSVESTVALVAGIVSQERDDGWRLATPTGEAIRDEDEYSGVRVTIPATLASARVSFHVDVNFGDPIWPAPREVSVPKLLGGSIMVRGYPLEMVHAEKIVTALQRGTANTRWRDFADVYLLSRHHAVHAGALSTAIAGVAEFRRTPLISLRDALDGYADLAETRWAAWVRRQRLLDRLPIEFAEVLSGVQRFADPILVEPARTGTWDPVARVWSHAV